MAILASCASGNEIHRGATKTVPAPADSVDPADPKNQENSPDPTDPKILQQKSKSAPPATSPDSNPNNNSASFALFESDVYPLLNQWCRPCHLQAQPPLLASSTSQAAFDSIMSAQLMDFNDPKMSRIYLRLAKDKHNCPAAGCDSAVATIEPKLIAWALSNNGNATNPGTKSLTSEKRLLSQASGKHDDSGLPESVYSFVAASGTIKAPFVLKAPAGTKGSNPVYSPAGAGSQTNLTTATTATNLGSVIFTANIATAGKYNIGGLVKGPTAANSSFYLKVDSGALMLWDFPLSGGDNILDIADGAAGTGTPYEFTLTAGPHTIEVRQREEQTELDTLILSGNPSYNIKNFASVTRSYSTLTFDLSSISGSPGTVFTIDVADYSVNAYIIKNPKLSSATDKIKVKNVKILINDKYLPQNATFSTIDDVVSPPSKVLASSSLVALKDKGIDQDMFSISFDILEKSP